MGKMEEVLPFEMSKHFICRNKDAMKDFISAEDRDALHSLSLWQNIDTLGTETVIRKAMSSVAIAGLKYFSPFVYCSLTHFRVRPAM